MDVIYTCSKINMNSYRIGTAIHIRWLLKIVNFRHAEIHSYLPKFSIVLFQCSVQPWPTEEGLALKQKVCCCTIKQKERLFPSNLNFVRSKQLLRGFWPHYSRCARLWNYVAIYKLWQTANTLFNHNTFNTGLFWQYCLWTPILLYKLAWKLSTLESSPSIHIDWKMRSLTHGACSEHQTCFLTATCTSELLRSSVNNRYTLPRCTFRAGLHLCSASTYAAEQPINPSSHLAFSDE